MEVTSGAPCLFADIRPTIIISNSEASRQWFISSSFTPFYVRRFDLKEIACGFVIITDLLP